MANGLVPGAQGPWFWNTNTQRSALHSVHSCFRRNTKVETWHLYSFFGQGPWFVAACFHRVPWQSCQSSKLRNRRVKGFYATTTKSQDMTVFLLYFFRDIQRYGCTVTTKNASFQRQKVLLPELSELVQTELKNRLQQVAERRACFHRVPWQSCDSCQSSKLRKGRVKGFFATTTKSQDLGTNDCVPACHPVMVLSYHVLFTVQSYLFLSLKK